jgi:TonB-linked SusC/RagA family outer membrane protein
MRKLILSLVVCLLGSLLVKAQNREITGKVTDSAGVPMAGASINVKGARGGTSAGGDGSFRINIPSGRKTLIISAIGFDAQEVDVSSSSTVSVRMLATTKSLNEVVVTALGIRRERRELGTATQTVNADMLNKSGSGNALAELEGKASGLTVITSTGDPGGGVYFRLRGVTSITGSNQPLMVVDGVPIDNSVNNYDPTNAGALASGANADLTGGAQPTNRGSDLNPDDIESINVLKGPAATALYGIQAASGAIIITTKKGSNRKGVGVTFNSSFTVDKVSALPPRQNQFAQGTHGVYHGPESATSTSWGPAIDTLFWDGATDYPWDKHGAIVGQSDPTAKTKVTPYNPYDFFQSGATYNNNIALSGGNDKGAYRMSLGNVDQTGIIPKTKYVKTTFSMNGQAKLSDRLTVAGGVTYVNSDNNKSQQGSSLTGIMLGLTRTTPTFDNSNGLKDPANNPAAYMFQDGTGNQRSYRGFGIYDNPYWVVNKDPFTSRLNRVYGYGNAGYKLLDWMDLGWRIGGDVYTQDDKDVYDINSGQFPNGAIFMNDYQTRQFNSDFTINMHKNFSGDFNGSLLVGHNYFTTENDVRFVQGQTFTIPGFYDLSNAASYIATETEAHKRTMAFYAEAELKYKDMYYLTLTGRQETSSTLPAKNNTFFFPSASLSWVFSELDAVRNSSLISFGKLRASFAQVGKDAPIYGLGTPFTPAFTKDGFTTGITYPVDGLSSYQLSNAVTTIGNPDLKPEKTYSYELGADVSFLKNRITVNATTYYSRSTGVIFPTSVAFTSGYAAKLLNAATIDNKGLELTLQTTPVKTVYGLRWDLTFNWSRNLNKVVSLAPGIDRFFVAGFGAGEAEIDAVAGKPFGVIYGSTFIHTDPANLKSPKLICDNCGVGTGQYQPAVVGSNEVIGNTNPDWSGSVISSLSYKGVTLGVQVDVRHGGDMWNGTRGALANKGVAVETKNRLTPVTFSGPLGHLDLAGNIVHDEGGVDKPGAGAANTTASTYDQYYWQNVGSSFVGPQEVDIENAGWTRIRQVSLTYELPKNALGKSKLSLLSLTIFANNPKIWTKYQGVDPETSLAGPSNAQGMDYFNAPGTKSYGIRLNLGL